MTSLQKFVIQSGGGKLHVENMKSSNIVGNVRHDVPNQFIITEVVNKLSGNCIQTFQSYQSVIARIDCFRPDIPKRKIWLDINKWDYSKTTSKYRNQFLGMTTKEIKEKIKTGEIELMDLNQ